jgi:hypothetical protein
MLFNFLSQIYALYKGDIKKINNFFSIKEVVIIHKKWWQNPLNPSDNIEGYNHDFSNYVYSIIKEIPDET